MMDLVCPGAPIKARPVLNELMCAVVAGDEARVRTLLGNGADPLELDVHGHDALWYAIRYEHEPIQRILEEHAENYFTEEAARNATEVAAHYGYEVPVSDRLVKLAAKLAMARQTYVSGRFGL